MTNYLDLRTQFAHEICSEVTQKLSNVELDEAIDVLISVREEVDRDTLRSVGILILNDGGVLLRAEPEVLSHILNPIRQASSSTVWSQAA